MSCSFRFRQQEGTATRDRTAIFSPLEKAVAERSCGEALSPPWMAWRARKSKRGVASAERRNAWLQTPGNRWMNADSADFVCRCALSRDLREAGGGLRFQNFSFFSPLELPTRRAAAACPPRTLRRGQHMLLSSRARLLGPALCRSLTTRKASKVSSSRVLSVRAASTMSTKSQKQAPKDYSSLANVNDARVEHAHFDLTVDFTAKRIRGFAKASARAFASAYSDGSEDLPCLLVSSLAEQHSRRPA